MAPICLSPTPAQVVEGSFCNADPNNPAEWEGDLAEKLRGEIKTCIQDAPFVQVGGG